MRVLTLSEKSVFLCSALSCEQVQLTVLKDNEWLRLYRDIIAKNSYSHNTRTSLFNLTYLEIIATFF